MFNRNNVKTAFLPMPTVASGATSSLIPMFAAPAACEVVGIRYVGSATLTSGWSLNVYKNASNASSRIATTGAVAATVANTQNTITITGSSALKKLAAGDCVVIELVNAQGGSTVGATLMIDYVFGYED